MTKFPSHSVTNLHCGLKLLLFDPIEVLLVNIIFIFFAMS